MMRHSTGFALAIISGSWLSTHAMVATEGEKSLDNDGPLATFPMIANLQFETNSDRRPINNIDSPQPILNLALSIKVFVAEDIHFPVNSSEMDSKSVIELKKLTYELSKYPTATVVCTGHTDNTGSDDYNLALGLRRAQSVKRLILTAGIPEENIYVDSRGESQPTVPNDSTANRALNRRATLEFGWRPDPAAQANQVAPKKQDQS